MKKKLNFFVLVLWAPLFLCAQKQDYKVVFDLTSKDTTTHRTVLRWINEITRETPDAQLEVVFYGQSLDMIRQDKSSVAAEVTALAKNKNVQFKVCQAAMKRHKVTQDLLLNGVQTVPDGIYELITRQKEGWGYIKVAQ